MKRWKYIRRTLASVGYTTIESAQDITIQSMDVDGWVYYKDQNGDNVKATYNTLIPIVVDSDTETIVFDSTIYIGGVSAYTYTYVVTNENALDVTSEITFFSNDIAIATTGGTNGRLITAIDDGATTVTLYHEDWDGVTNATASGITTVTVGQVNSSLLPSGGTLDTNGDGVYVITSDVTTLGALGAYYLTTGITIQNQDSESVTRTNSVLRYTIDGGTATVLTTPISVLDRAVDSTIVIYDVNAISYDAINYTGVSYTAHYVGAQSLINTTSIYLGGLSAWTATIESTGGVNNENGVGVTDEIIVTVPDLTVVSTGGTLGRTLTAVAEGTKMATLTHRDYDSVYNTSAYATAIITVGQLNTEVNCSGGTLGTLDVYAFQITASTNYYLETGVTLYNQDSDSIVHGTTADIYFTKDYGSGVSGAYAYNMAFFVDVTGTTSLVIFDINARTAGGYTGQTYTVTVV